MSFHVIIPARFASSRLPGKPLLDLNGKPLIQHVYDRACQSDALSVTIATDDERIYQTAKSFTDNVEMTAVEHPNGSCRIAEVAQKKKFADNAVLVNVQGDEPLIPFENINQVGHLLQDEEREMATLSLPIIDIDDLSNPNIVKVVTDKNGCALYFSRSLLPWSDDENRILKNYHRHIGLYAYRYGFLKKYITWPEADLERSERLEQCRALYQGTKIYVQSCIKNAPIDVNTLADLELLRETLLETH